MPTTLQLLVFAIVPPALPMANGREQEGIIVGFLCLVALSMPSIDLIVMGLFVALGIGLWIARQAIEENASCG